MTTPATPAEPQNASSGSLAAPISPPVPATTEAAPVAGAVPGGSEYLAPVEAPARRNGPPWLAPALIGGVVGAAGAVAAMTVVPAALSAIQESPLEEAYASCELESAVGIELRDDGKTITFDSKGEEDLTGASIVEIACILSELDMPSSISSHIDQTTSMDGRQSESWNGKTISWSYHPDRGLDGVLTLD